MAFVEKSYFEFEEFRVATSSAQSANLCISLHIFAYICIYMHIYLAAYLLYGINNTGFRKKEEWRVFSTPIIEYKQGEECISALEVCVQYMSLGNSIGPTLSLVYILQKLI